MRIINTRDSFQTQALSDYQQPVSPLHFLSASRIISSSRAKSTHSISENTVEEQKEELESDDEEESQEDEIQYEKDPETGNLIDPVSGQQIDPETYEFVDPTFSLFE